MARFLPLGTACTQEELGIDPVAVTVVGCLPPFLSKHLLSVTPVVGVIPPHLQFRPNPTEASGAGVGQHLGQRSRWVRFEAAGWVGGHPCRRCVPAEAGAALQGAAPALPPVVP